MNMNKIRDILIGSEKPHSLVLGLVLAIIIVIVAIYTGKYIEIALGFEKSPISIIMLAIIFGIIVKNTIGVPQVFTPGIKFCMTKILRMGIIMLGAGLSIFTVIKVGVLTVGIVAVCIFSGLVITYFIAKKTGLDKRLGTLIAVGTGICGASAIVATGSVIKARENEIAYAIATITIFGIIAMFIYPYITDFAGLTEIQAGIVMGTGIHETSQVTGAGMMYDHLHGSDGSVSGGEVAVITKLVRNIFIIVVIPLMVCLYLRHKTQGSEKKVSVFGLFPLFVFGFILAAMARSIGDYLIINNGMLMDPATWDGILLGIKNCTGYFLAIAMAGVGLSTNLRELKNLGLKPFLVGLFGALSIGVISLILVVVFVQYLVI